MLDTAGNVKSYLLSVAVRLWRNHRRKAAWRNKRDAVSAASRLSVRRMLRLFIFIVGRHFRDGFDKPCDALYF